ncbi:hypothetical protein [Phaeocystidibacter luteus]|uniref:Uncharacterized protein n=1 Tax=Phaeocystidibacter luteus TaxID=911197 RepID=A0A6N6RJT5_9FLAO|nr:hypothetical protein [Phaeocystidibacter luteus]KAB2814027.1 hypothetical protein F8C67_04930 [Phaeocystidibacter luteus]
MSQFNKETLNQLCREILDLDGSINPQILKKLEELYEEALLANYLEERKNALNTLQKRVMERAAASADSEDTNIPAPKAEAPIQPVKEEQPSRQFGDEVKVLPHPEGPPKPAPKPAPEPVAKEQPASEPVKEDAPNAQEPEKPKAVEPPKEVVEALEAKSSSNGSSRLTKLNIGLNDRIAFVKQLFMGSQEDYQRVISQINTMDDYDETIDFVQNVVKLDYDWSEVEETEQRLMDLVANRFNK